MRRRNFFVLLFVNQNRVSILINGNSGKREAVSMPVWKIAKVFKLRSCQWNSISAKAVA